MSTTKRITILMIVVATGLFMLSPAGRTLATKISDLTSLTLSDVSDTSDIAVLASKNLGTVPESVQVTLEELGSVLDLRKVTATSHGLSASDVGKPLYGSTIVDDTNTAHYTTWVLAGVVDANTLLVVGDGGQVTIDTTLIESGASYNPASSGYAVYWDASDARYESSKPADSTGTMKPALIVTEVGASTFNAIVVSQDGLGDASDYQITIRGTGTAATDTTAFSNAVVAFEATGRGTIWIDGTVSINANISIDDAVVHLFGIHGTSPKISYVGDVGIGYNMSFNPYSGTSYTVASTSERQAYLKVPLAANIASGDWILATSEDTIEGVTHQGGPDNIRKAFTADAGTDTCTSSSHGLANNDAVILRNTQIPKDAPGGLSVDETYWVIGATTNTFQLSLTQGGSAVDITDAGTGTHYVNQIYAYCPGEIMQVKEIRATDATYDYVIFDGYIVDALTVNPRIYILSMLDGIHVEGLTFSQASGSPTVAALHFRKCSNVTVSDCKWEHDGPNEILTFFCANVEINDVIMENAVAYATGEGYGIVAGGATTGLHIYDCVLRGRRHAFTTGGFISSGLIRYGTVKNCSLHNVTAASAGKTSDAHVTFDTHESGWGITFDSCRVEVPFDPRNPSAASPAFNPNYAFQSRSRATVWRNCVIEGSGSTYGIRIMAKDNRVENCTFLDGWRGVRISDGPSDEATLVDGAHITGCTFRNMHGAGIMVEVGTGHFLEYNTFDDVGSTSYSGVTASYIHIDNEPTDVTIRHNALDKSTNTYSIGGSEWSASDVLIAGNTMTGYTGGGTTTDSGLDATATDATAMQAEADAYNFTD